MARHRRTLEEQLADSFSQNRAAAGVTYSTPGMTALGPDMLMPGAVTAEKFSEELTADLNQRIDDAAASIVTAERLGEGVVQANNIADFAISVKKLRSDRHHLY